MIDQLHCTLKDTNPFPPQAVLGEHDVRVSTETQLRIERSIVSKVRHPDYNDDTLKNDIALFKMDSPVRIK